MSAPYRRCLLLVACTLHLVLVAPNARANGWEHGAVPFEALVAALQQESSAIRLKAAQSLGFRGQAEAVPSLIALLAKPDPSRHVRGAVAVALGRIGDARALDPLVACLQGDRREEVRGDCARGLGLLADERAVGPLLEAVDGDAVPIVQSRVVDALGAFDDAEATEALIALLSAKDKVHLRIRAIRALGSSRAEAAVGPLLAVLQAPRDELERAQTVEALGRLGSSDARAPLNTLLAESDDPQLRLRIVIALAAIRDGSSLPALIESLRDRAVAVRYFAVNGLREIGDPKAAPGLRDFARQTLDRLATLSPSARLRASEAIRAELSALEQAIWALVELDPGGSLQVFLQAGQPYDIPATSGAALAMADAYYLVRRVALRGLGYAGGDEARDMLEGAAGLQDTDPRLRAVAVRARAVLGGKGATERLLPSLEDNASDVRANAAVALGRLGDKAAVAPLIDRLVDPVAAVRRQSVLALAYLGDTSALEAVGDLAAKDSSDVVREAAAYAVDLLSQN